MFQRKDASADRQTNNQYHLSASDLHMSKARMKNYVDEDEDDYYLEAVVQPDAKETTQDLVKQSVHQL